MEQYIKYMELAYKEAKKAERKSVYAFFEFIKTKESKPKKFTIGSSVNSNFQTASEKIK